MKLKTIFITILSGIVFALPVQAEFVFLKNGSIIEGKIVTDSADSITIRDKENKEKIIQRNSIMRMLYTSLKMGKIYIQKRDGEGIVAFMVDEDRDTYTFRKELYKPEEFVIQRSDVLFLAEKNPSSLKGIAETDRVSLTWLPPYDSVKKYNVYYSAGKNEKFKLAGSAWGKSYTLKNLLSNKTYHIIVTSVDSDNYESSPSNELKITTKNIAPNPPDKISITKKIDEKTKKLNVTLTWDAVTDVDGKIKEYRIYRKDAKDFAAITKNEYEVKNLDPEKIYKFEISSLDNNDEESPKSGKVSTSDFLEYNINIQLNYILPMGKFKDVHKLGYGALLCVNSENTFFDNFDLGFEMGYWQFKAADSESTEVDSSLMIPFALTAGYRINLFSTFYLVPRIALGGSYNYMKYNVEFRSNTTGGIEYENKTKWSFEPLALCGLVLEFDVMHGIYIKAGSDYCMLYEKSGIMPFVLTKAGAGLRF